MQYKNKTKIKSFVFVYSLINVYNWSSFMIFILWAIESKENEKRKDNPLTILITSWLWLWVFIFVYCEIDISTISFLLFAPSLPFLLSLSFCISLGFFSWFLNYHFSLYFLHCFDFSEKYCNWYAPFVCLVALVLNLMFSPIVFHPIVFSTG